ncbi:MAG TPA: hypothetical protein ENI22_00370 [Candidatus Pacearchaeota archaeon]|nr:hypothetical protein [Candidatus Pacearchaeota archaeon]
MEKKYLLLIFSVLVVVSFFANISAAAEVRLEVENRSNISSATYFLNSSITGLTGNVNIRNVSFYYQVFGGSTWTLIATTNNVSVNQSYFNTTWDTTAVADGRNYTLNVTSMDYDAGTVNATNITVSVTIDDTAPTIAVYGISPTAYANGTSIKTSTSSANNLTLSLYITDATMGIANQSDPSVCFVNAGGGVNHTIPMFYTSLTTGWCNASDTNATTAANISGLSDGNNTINIYVNDTITNLLNSTLVVQIDTTDPVPTATCSPTSVQTGDTFPCTCSGSDATSGVSTSTGASTSNSITSTSNTGTFTYTCGVTDNGGLTSSASKTYTVGQPPNSGSSGTTTPSWTTHVIGDGAFEQGHTRQLAVRNRLKVQVSSEDHFVGVLSITEDKVTIEISSDPVQVTLAVGEDAKADVNGNGFYDIYVLLNGIIGNNANVTIQKINEEVPEGGSGIETGGEVVGEDAGTDGDGDGGGIPTFVWILIILVVLILIWKGMKKKGK